MVAMVAMVMVVMVLVMVCILCVWVILYDSHFKILILNIWGYVRSEVVLICQNAMSRGQTLYWLGTDRELGCWWCAC